MPNMCSDNRSVSSSHRSNEPLQYKNATPHVAKITRDALQYADMIFFSGLAGNIAGPILLGLSKAKDLTNGPQQFR